MVSVIMNMLTSTTSESIPVETIPLQVSPVSTVAPEVVVVTGSSVADVIGTVFENLTNSGYQTGVALAVTTAALVAMLNLKVHKAVIGPVAIGAFWAGWLGWNTFSGNDNPLFPGEVSATKLWDVATTSDTGFLLVVTFGCVAAIFLWRTTTGIFSRFALLIGAVLGASFVYDLIEAVRYA